MKYEYLKHTADLKVRAYGKTLEEAFANVAIGGFDFLTDTAKIKKKVEKKISITSKRLESLLYDFIEELLFLLDTEGFIISGFKDMKIVEDKNKNTYSLKCIALGDSYKNYQVKGDIKAITYSDMLIKTEERKGGQKAGFEIQVVFDI
jgi:SHS2 domain-containing protein